MSLIGAGLVTERSLAARRPDRAGDAEVGQGAQRVGALLQRGLPAQDLIELVLDLLLVEQLPARHPIDLRAQFGDAILVAKLHLGLPRDQAREHVVAKGEIGRGEMVHAAMITSEPTVTQKAIGPSRIGDPAWASV